MAGREKCLPRSLTLGVVVPSKSQPMSSNATTSPSMSWLGLRLNDRYRVVAEMGGGGMAVVYRGWDTRCPGYVVIKAPRLDLLASPGFRERFTRELEVIQSLDHSAIVRLQ
jgi:serine/threonine protein kinase